jgi:MFS family permease
LNRRHLVSAEAQIDHLGPAVSRKADPLSDRRIRTPACLSGVEKPAPVERRQNDLEIPASSLFLASVYQSDTPRVSIPWSNPRFWSRAWRAVAPNVWYLGLTSLLTDISSEMIVSVLPMYLVLELNVSPLAFGAIDGLYNGVTALVRWVSGVAGDRWRRHKEIAAVGYAVSAACRLGLLAAGPSLSALAAVMTSDRVGKGIRTAPRDALISLSTPDRGLAHAFGVHRALDAAGAMLGPLVSVSLLAAIPRGFDVVFVVSFSIAVVGVGVLVLFVKNVIPADAVDDHERRSWRVSLGVLRHRDFRFATLVAAGLALVTISDAFVYLTLREKAATPASLFPLFYVGTSAVYLLLAIPAGLLADHLGRAKMFLLGHVTLLALYVLLFTNVSSVVLALALLGAYYAMTDGVVAALASGTLPAAMRGSGLALLTTATSLSRFVASIAFGWLWLTASRGTAIAVFGAALAVALGAAIFAFRSMRMSTNE